jgi:hypothetical protein
VYGVDVLENVLEAPPGVLSVVDEVAAAGEAAANTDVSIH